MTERLSAAESADLIWDALEKAMHAGKTKADLLTTTGLTGNQFARGLEWIKDVFRHERQQPIVITPDDHRYILTCFAEESSDYLVWTLKGLHRRLTRADGGVSAHVGRFSPENGTLVQKQMTRLVEDVSDVLALFGEAV